MFKSYYAVKEIKGEIISYKLTAEDVAEAREELREEVDSGRAGEWWADQHHEIDYPVGFNSVAFSAPQAMELIAAACGARLGEVAGWGIYAIDPSAPIHYRVAEAVALI